MLKKVITTAVLGVSALGVMAANAATPGVYVSGQLGYANTHMGNKINIANDMKLFPENIISDVSVNRISDNGIAGRLALGYQFNQNFALEMGYMQLRGNKVNATYKLGVDEDNKGILENANLTLNQNAIDLVVKGILPVTSNLNVYGKLGAAYLTTTASAKTNIVGPDGSAFIPQLTFDFPEVAKHKLAPEAAIGVSYDITPNVSVDTSWTHIQPVGKNRPGNIDFVAVGLGYHFG